MDFHCFPFVVSDAFVAKKRSLVCYVSLISHATHRMEIYVQNSEHSKSRNVTSQSTGADPVGGAGALPPLGRNLKNAPFNSIQASVHHWAPTPGRNPVSVPDSHFHANFIPRASGPWIVHRVKKKCGVNGEVVKRDLVALKRA